jgi:hypothetical protein
MPNFEVFDKRAAPASDEPMITVQRKGPISLNHAAYRALGEPAYVELLYDAEERIIGVRALQEKLPHAYPVRRQGRSHTFLIAGHAFIRHFGIPNEVSKRYVAQMFDEVLGVDLKKPGVEVTSNRAGRSERVAAASQ